MPKPIALTKGKFAIVSDEDYDRVMQFRWSFWSNKCTRTGYAVRGIDNKSMPLHRFIMEPPPGMCVDHINGNGLDCRRENLRICTYKDNLKNKQKHVDSNAPYKGIRKSGQKWNATIMADGQRYDLGSFDTPEDAARAYNEAAIKYHGDFSWLNEIPGDEVNKQDDRCDMIPNKSIWIERDTISPNLYTIKQVAEILHVDQSQVYRYCYDGILKSCEVFGRRLIHKDDLAKFTKPPKGRPRKETR